jgi:hypothetical protein
MVFDTAMLLLPFWDIVRAIDNQRILKHCRQQLDYVNTKNTTSLLRESRLCIGPEPLPLALLLEVSKPRFIRTFKAR